MYYCKYILTPFYKKKYSASPELSIFRGFNCLHLFIHRWSEVKDNLNTTLWLSINYMKKVAHLNHSSI